MPLETLKVALEMSATAPTLAQMIEKERWSTESKLISNKESINLFYDKFLFYAKCNYALSKKPERQTRRILIQW